MKKATDRDVLPCMCCAHLSIEEYGTFEICPVCFWDDDNLQKKDPDRAGGTNALSLNQSRENYRIFGAVKEKFIKKVRPPRQEEIHEGNGR